MNHTPRNVKIVGGKLLKIPLFSNHHHDDNQSISSKTQMEISVGHHDDSSYTSRHQRYNNASHVSYGGPGSEVNLNWNNEIEAQHNKAKALAQTYRSVLDAEPDAAIHDVMHDKIEEKCPPSAVLVQGVKHCLCGTNRQKLLYTHRAMQRLDANQTGTLHIREFRDILLMYKIYILGGTLEKLVEYFKTRGGKVQYQHLWSFVLECYDGDTETTTTTSSKIGNHKRTSIINKKSKPIVSSFDDVTKDLRNYAENHEKLLDLKDFRTSLQNCDRSNTGVMGINEMKVLSAHYLPLSEASMNHLLQECHSSRAGWIEYGQFLNMLHSSQPIYLPPIERHRERTFVIDGNQDHEDNNLNKNQPISRVGTSHMSVNNQSVDATRRRWYESEDSWKKRKGPSGKKKSGLSRKLWKHSAPVRSLHANETHLD